MTLSQLLDELSARGVVLKPDGDSIIYRAPRGALTLELRQELARLKPQIMARLQENIQEEKSSQVDTTLDAPGGECLCIWEGSCLPGPYFTCPRCRTAGLCADCLGCRTC
jgi:hypothetical protein